MLIGPGALNVTVVLPESAAPGLASVRRRPSGSCSSGSRRRSNGMDDSVEVLGSRRSDFGRAASSAAAPSAG